MGALQDNATRLFHEISGRSSFSVRDLEESLGVGRNTLRGIVDCALVDIVKKGSGPVANRYRLNACSIAEFRAAIKAQETVPLGKDMIAVCRTAEPVNWEILAERMANVAKAVSRAAEATQPFGIDAFIASYRESLTAALQQFEVWENDSRYGNDDTRWSVLL